VGQNVVLWDTLDVGVHDAEVGLGLGVSLLGGLPEETALIGRMRWLSFP